MPGEDRTEAATPRKRTEVRKRGQIAKSHDLSSMTVFLGIVMCMHAVGGIAISRLQSYMSRSMAHLDATPLTVHSLFARAADGLMLLGATVGPFLLTAMVLGALVNMLQTGFLVAPAALKPDFMRL